MKKELLPADRDELLNELKTRFEKNMDRHKGLEWAPIQAKLQADTAKLWSLSEMDRTGGEPDVVGLTTRLANIFSTIAAPKPPPAAAAFVTTAPRGRQGKSINRKTTRSTWPAQWALSC